MSWLGDRVTVNRPYQLVTARQGDEESPDSTEHGGC